LIARKQKNNFFSLHFISRIYHNDERALAFCSCVASRSPQIFVIYLHMQQTASILTESSGGVQSGKSGLRT